VLAVAAALVALRRGCARARRGESYISMDV